MRWHEPFGTAVIKRLLFGPPVFATPYGALPKLVDAENGVLSNNIRLLAEGVQQFQSNRRRNHERAQDMFNAMRMARDYLQLYTDLLNGAPPTHPDAGDAGVRHPIALAAVSLCVRIRR